MNLVLHNQYLPPHFKTQHSFHSFPKLPGVLADDGWKLSPTLETAQPSTCFIPKSPSHLMTGQWGGEDYRGSQLSPLFGTTLQGYPSCRTPPKIGQGFYCKWTTVQLLPLLNAPFFTSLLWGIWRHLNTNLLLTTNFCLMFCSWEHDLRQLVAEVVQGTRL